MSTRLLLGLLGILTVSDALAQSHRIASPDGKLVVETEIVAPDNRLTYRITSGGKPVAEGRLGVDAGYRNHRWDRGFELRDAATRGVDDSWTPVYGERDSIPDRFNELQLTLSFPDEEATMRVEIRAYDEGAAFRYAWPEQTRLSILTIDGDATTFTFPPGTRAWHTPRAQARYERIALAEWREEAEMPLTLETPAGLYLSVTEAGLVNFSRSRLTTQSGAPNTLALRMFDRVVESSPFETPWRLILVGERPGALLEHNYLLLNLNPPSRIGATDWIRPGKAIREMTLSTAGARALVDFAADHGLDYVHFDAGWYGHEYLVDADATTVTVDSLRNPRQDLDLHAAIRYARSKGLGVILYVNHRALERQMRTLFPLYRAWGVAGVKFGFVQTGSHRWLTWLYDAVALAAEHHLMVNIHDEFRPTGHSRTLPNLMTQEGIYGNEEMPDATHNTILPFTRFVAGAADYTPAYYFREEFGHPDRHIRNTPAHQLALPALYYSPLQWLYWYDVPSRDYQGEPELQFWADVPTVWDDTRVVDGDIGVFAIVARRSGADWFAGAITNTEARTVSIPLDFLEPETDYVVDLYTDGGDEVTTRTHVQVAHALVRSRQTMVLDLLPSGGAALRFTPATADDAARYPLWPRTGLD
ncbi:MAG: glycoside hydrolase family 97 catalytic domain-containing protein [Rhodothermales bacterium]